MNNNFNIHDNTVHLWRLFVPDFTRDTLSLSELLNQDEHDRANRFHFAIHKERFLIIRGLLRKTLSLYTGIDAKTLTFHYGEHGKPFLANTDLRFNVSHSHDMAIFALTVHKEIGVDVEKTEASFKESVAKRFFSSDEYTELMQLPDTERIIAFYKIWSRKEALIKVLGKGLFTPLDSFTVSSQKDSQIVLLHAHNYLVKDINMHADYQAAFVVIEPVNDISEWQWIEDKPVKK